MWRSFPSILFIGLAGGCQGSPHFSAAEGTIQVSSSAETAIAGDMANHFIESAGKPAPVLLSASTDQSAEALGAALKQWGYPVISRKDKGSANKPELEIAYSITAFEDVVLAQLATPAFTLSRAYRADTSGARATNALAVIRHR